MLLEEVKRKKEYRGLSDDFVSRILVDVSRQYDLSKEKERKKVVKETRAKLRELYWAFRTRNFHRKEKYLEAMKAWDDLESCEKILNVHLSSKERLDYYPKLYKKIRQHVNFKTVLDVGCGLNVFSLPWMGDVQYYGIDVNREDTEFCNKYLGKFGKPGAVRWGDVLSFGKFIQSDVCFMFKSLEGFEALERGTTAKLLKKIPARYIVASFATQSLGGKKKISSRRLKWFEDLVPVEEKFKLGQEIYYVVRR